MAIQTLSFTTLVQNMVAAIQARATAALDLTVGSVNLALTQAYAGVVLWLESIALAILALTRAATSSGTDLDSWMADFSFFREAATNATGAATFSRLSSTAQAVVPVGATVQTADGTQGFTVSTDTTNPAYSASLGGYVMGSGTSSVSVPVQAVNAGTQGNVLAGTVTVITSSIPGVDLVTNAAAFTNAVDAETDGAFRARFILYIQGLSKATPVAVESAIAGVQQGLSYKLVENQDYSGTTDYGYFYVVVDDGTGTPSSTLLSSVNNAIDAVRGLGIRFGVFAPVVVTATPEMTITSGSGYVHANVVAAVTTALQTAINALGLGVTLPYTQLAAIAYAVPGVTNVTSITLNGGTSDLTATVQQVIKCGTPVVA